MSIFHMSNTLAFKLIISFPSSSHYHKRAMPFPPLKTKSVVASTPTLRVSNKPVRFTKIAPEVYVNLCSLNYSNLLVLLCVK